MQEVIIVYFHYFSFLPTDWDFRGYTLIDFITSHLYEILTITIIPIREEIWNVVFFMSRNQAPRLNDFPIDFYTACWDIVKIDLVHAIKEFFYHKVLSQSWKATFIALIPKVANPISFKDFWPISLYNVCYKVISKIITTWLRVFLDMPIYLKQCGFVKGWHIYNNIILVYELV